MKKYNLFIIALFAFSFSHAQSDQPVVPPMDALDAPVDEHIDEIMEELFQESMEIEEIAVQAEEQARKVAKAEEKMKVIEAKKQVRIKEEE